MMGVRAACRVVVVVVGVLSLLCWRGGAVEVESGKAF